MQSPKYCDLSFTWCIFWVSTGINGHQFRSNTCGAIQGNEKGYLNRFSLSSSVGLILYSYLKENCIKLSQMDQILCLV